MNERESLKREKKKKAKARKVFFQLFGNKVFLKYAKLYVQNGSVRCKNKIILLTFILFYLPIWSRHGRQRNILMCSISSLVHALLIAEITYKESETERKKENRKK